MMPRANRRITGFNTALGFISIVLWSSTVALARSLSEQLGLLTAGALVYGLAGILGCIVLGMRRRLGETLRALSPGFVLSCGALFVLYQLLLYLALGLSANRSQVLEVALVHYLWPMLTLFAAVMSLRLRPHPLFWLGGAVAMGGVGLVMIKSEGMSWQAFQGNLAHNAAPYLCALAAACTWAVYSAFGHRWSSEAHSRAVVLWMLLTGVALGLARFFFPETPQPRLDMAWELPFMVVSANIAYSFWELAVRKGQVILVVSVSYLTPLLSTVFSSLYLGARLGWTLWVGCALVVSGAIMCNFTKGKHQCPNK